MLYLLIIYLRDVKFNILLRTALNFGINFPDGALNVNDWFLGYAAKPQL